MADKDYPSFLPGPTRQNYDFQHISPFVRTEMSTGRARQRRTFQNVPSLVNLTWYFDRSEARLFEGWFKYELTDGVDWFNITLHNPKSGFSSYECRFAEMYTGPTLNNADDWQFSAQLEVRERPTITLSEWLAATNGVQAPFNLAAEEIEDGGGS